MKNNNKATRDSRLKVRTFLLLVVVYVISFKRELNWVWGVLFLLWVIPHIRAGAISLAEPIDRRENPIWFWLIVVTWVWMSVYLIAAPFLERLQ